MREGGRVGEQIKPNKTLELALKLYLARPPGWGGGEAGEEVFTVRLCRAQQFLRGRGGEERRRISQLRSI